MPNATSSSRKSRRPKPRLTAKTADPHLLYQRAVQEPSAEIDFFDRVFRSLYGRKALSLREDFCGTALLCGAWVESIKGRTATGIDIDRAVLGWGRKYNLEPLGDARTRVTLLCQDVRRTVKNKHELVCALNFSYWVFRTREAMRGYFESVRRGLAREGAFVLDVYGGWESHEPMLERTRKRGFTYVWDQDRFDPVTHSMENHIHFEFPDGTKLNRAFSYYWRFWSLPELQELLTEAGFSEVTVYWDISRDFSHDDFRPRTRAENQPGWLAYLVATP